MNNPGLTSHWRPRAVSHIGRFATFIGTPVKEATPEDVRPFRRDSALDPVSLPLGASNPRTLFAALKTEH